MNRWTAAINKYIQSIFRQKAMNFDCSFLCCNFIMRRRISLILCVYSIVKFISMKIKIKNEKKEKKKIVKFIKHKFKWCKIMSSEWLNGLYGRIIKIINKYKGAEKEMWLWRRNSLCDCSSLGASIQNKYSKMREHYIWRPKSLSGRQ
ncbi:hypothetical protein ACKWTF_001022 [Chironomus riparius]